MSKPRKKYNPNKGKELTAKRAMRHLHVAFVTGANMDKCVLIDSRDGTIYNPTQIIADAITKLPFHWTLHLAGFGRKENGIEFMEVEVITTRNKYLQSDLVDYLNDRHQALIKGMNQNRLVGAGWLANISGRVLDEPKLIELFQKLGAWD